MFIIKSRILDINSQEPLSFASAVLTDKSGKPLPINGQIIGNKANDAGELTLPVANEDAFIKVSYVGYQTIVHPADDYRNDDIYLAPKANAATGKDIIIKEKRIYPGSRTRPTANKPKPAEKWPKWLTWVLVGTGILIVTVVGILITKSGK